MRRVVFNQKGGVGKSSIAVNLAAISAARGVRTLVVDLDPQCNSTHYLLGDEANAPEQDIRDFFEQTLSFQLKPTAPQTYVHPTPFDNLALIPSHPDLGDLQSKLESKHKIYKLREALETLLEEYDAIYIDTPPAFNFFTLSALCAADRCLIPFDCDDFARQALYSLMNNVLETRAEHNDQLEVEGSVVNQYQPRASLPQRIVAELLAESLPVLNTRIPASVKMKESHTAARPLIQLAPKHPLTAAFVSLYDELHPS
jgi:chromosome partitioning protein